jgi:site-specific DNA-methyltransferase (cytosine-N4-specific)
VNSTTPYSRIHPYPAMVADGVARRICESYVRPGMRVLDPFCGTGRLVVTAAMFGAEAIGIDLNPLAILICRAKRPLRQTERILRLLADISASKGSMLPDADFDVEPSRGVPWFSARVRRELSLIIRMINGAGLAREEALLCATVLSATTREVSYARQDQWKLHRKSAGRRAERGPSAREVFSRRVGEFIREATVQPAFAGSADYLLGNSMEADRLLHRSGHSEQFDLVVTSPPYGDSKTTVQYGAMSSLSLGVIRHIAKAAMPFRTGGEIDREALGGAIGDLPREDLRMFWAGSAERPEARRVSSFLDDFQRTLEQVGRLTAPRGVAVLIVGRRLVGGWRLQLDRFVRHILARSGFRMVGVVERTLRGKTTPARINRMARSTAAAKRNGGVVTMRSELVLVLQKEASASPARMAHAGRPSAWRLLRSIAETATT